MIPKLKPYRNEDYLKFIRAHPCGICHKPGPSDPHHVRKSYWGAGVGIKPHDLVSVPRCRECHDNTALIDEQSLLWREIIELLMEYIEKRRRKPKHKPSGRK